MKVEMRVILVLVSLVCMQQAFAITGTYVDVTPDNTMAVDGTDPWFNPATMPGLWRQRAFGNESSIYENFTGRVDLKTTLTGLTPGQTYNIYGVYWSKSPGENWGILSNPYPYKDWATWYNFENGVQTDVIILGSIYEMEAFLDVATASEAGEIDVYTFDHAHITTGHRSWLDGFSYTEGFTVSHPQPGNNSDAVALNSSLKWALMQDEANPGQVMPGITKQVVYLGDTPVLGDDQFLAEVSASSTQVNAPVLQANSKYYWAVDTYLSNGSVILSPLWTFETVKTLPDFNPPLGLQPKNARAAEGEVAVLAARAATTGSNSDPIAYQWYKGLPGSGQAIVNDPNHIAGADSNELTIVMTAADEGSYYCRASVDNGHTDSEAATLQLNKLLAWYSFEDKLTDAISEQDGTMVNPVYTEGIDGKALVFDGNELSLGTASFPKPGLGNGLEAGSISLWINTNSPNTSFFSVNNGTDRTGIRFDYDIGNNLTVAITDDDGVQAINQLYPAGSILGDWHLLTATWDTENGNVNIWVDGISQGLASSGQPANFSAWQNPVIIGARQTDGVLDWFFDGAIDDLRIYNYPLDGYDVAKLYTDFAGGSICVEYPEADLNRDCKVDQLDLDILMSQWLQCNIVPETACDLVVYEE